MSLLDDWWWFFFWFGYLIYYIKNKFGEIMFIKFVKIYIKKNIVKELIKFVYYNRKMFFFMYIKNDKWEKKWLLNSNFVVVLSYWS